MTPKTFPKKQTVASQPPWASSVFMKDLEKRWKEARKSPMSPLLRLGILRDLRFLCHAHLSLLSAGHNPKADFADAERIQALNHRVAEIQKLLEKSILRKSFTGSLTELLSDPQESPWESGTAKKEKDLLKKLGKIFDISKLERYDRKWEFLIAKEAVRSQCQFWAYETGFKSEQIKLVEKVHQTICNRLWPKAIVLFVETASPPGKGTSSEENLEPSWPIWYGRWWIATPHKTPPRSLQKALTRLTSQMIKPTLKKITRS